LAVPQKLVVTIRDQNRKTAVAAGELAQKQARQPVGSASAVRKAKTWMVLKLLGILVYWRAVYSKPRPHLSHFHVQLWLQVLFRVRGPGPGN
jgi:hypothetical protein